MFISSSVVAQEVSRSPRINFKGITGDDFIGQAGILYPFKNAEDSLWFTDFRYRISSDDVDEWNLGLGYRKKLENYDNRIAGAYIFKDRRNEYDYDWDMWTVGGELLTDEWDFRLNGYITNDETIDAPQNDEIIVKSQKLYYKEGFLSSMNGLDFEVGKRFADRDDWLKNVGVYLKLFSFFEDDADTMYGHQLRIDKQFGDLNKTTWKLGAKWRDDDTRGSETEATFAVSIPFGKGRDAEDTTKNASSSQIIEARMTEQPERDLDVVVAESNDPELTEAKNLDGSSLGNVIFVSADGSGDGSSKSNPTNIIDLNTLSGEGDVIIFMGDDGIIYPSSSVDYSDYALKNGQKLLSAAGELILASENMDKQTVFSPDVKQAVLSNSNANDVLVLADNTLVSGIHFNNGNNIISGSGISGDITITNNEFIKGSNAVNISNTSEDSIDILTFNISKNNFRNFSDDSIYLSSNTTGKNDIYISENKFSYTTNNAVDLDLESIEAENILVLKDNNILAADDEAFEINLNSANNNTVQVINNYFENIDYDALYINATAENNNDFEIVDNVIKLAGDSGLDIDITSNNASNNLKISGNSIEMSEYDGFEIDIYAGLDNIAEISNNYFGSIEDDGIDFYANANENNILSFTKNYFNVTDYDGIYISANAENGLNDIRVAQNTINSAFDEGIYIYSNNTIGNLKMIVEENIIHSSEYEAIDVSSYIYDGDSEIIIQNNKVENSFDEPLNVYTYADGGLYLLNINNNSFKNSPDDGLYVSLHGNSKHQVNISDNVVENIDDDGIDVYMSDLTGDTVVNIHNNIIKNLTNYGIRLYSSNSTINTAEYKFNVTKNELNNILDNAINVSFYRLDNVEMNVIDNSLNNVGRSGLNIGGYRSTINGEISGNIINSAYYAVRLNAGDYDGLPSLLEEYFLISENEFNGTGFAAVYLYTTGSSEINVEVNDNLMSEYINMLFEENGDNINIIGNQAP
jgi:hypothetical protein